MKRVPAVLVLALLLASGCTKQVVVSPKEIHPGMDVRNARVTTLDGYVYYFDRLTFSADSLTGYTTVVRESNENDEIAYVEEPRETRLSLAIIDNVSRQKREVGQTVLYGLGLLGMGIIMADLADVDTGDEDGGPTGKPPISDPPPN
ncbi:MAG: hypothetical protein GF355_12595 [Candidatus Eisenbacteria bacterium]|nr:hypothetical protein [Candidatus Eisenbacteria bacterium]